LKACGAAFNAWFMARKKINRQRLIEKNRPAPTPARGFFLGKGGLFSSPLLFLNNY